MADINEVKDRLERALARLEGATQGRLARRMSAGTMTELEAARKPVQGLETVVREAEHRLDATILRLRALIKE